MTGRLVAALALGALLATGRAAEGQGVRLDSAADPPAVAACLDAIPAAAFARVAVHVTVRTDDSLALRPLLPAADLLAQGVAQRVRGMVEAGGDAGEAMPAADALVPWRSVPGGVHVTVHRDGRLAWTRSDTGARRTADSAATALVARALADVHAAGERVAWPDGLAGDSATFALWLDGPTIRRDGSTSVEGVRRAFAAFTLALPWAEPVTVTRPARIAYPESSLRGNAEGAVILQFIVDERGEVRRETIAEQWPASRPRLRGDLGRFYSAFLRAATRGVPTATYEPARIGGCAVPQLVQQAFAYGIRR